MSGLKASDRTGGTTRKSTTPQTSVQRQARALGDPTRHAIYRRVVEAAAPLDVPTLTAHFGLNHNAIRQHLAKLVEAGLVIEEKTAPGGRGRPRLKYRPSPEVAGSWGTPSPYEQLSLMLLDMVASRESAHDVGALAGRRIGRRSKPGADPVDQIEAVAARQGFEPRRVERPTSVELILGRCPFESAALADPDTVCDMHLGLAQGIAESTGGAVEVTGLIAHNPRRAGCRLQIERTGN